MNRLRSNDVRVLGIAPSSRGFGFAVLEGDGLVDWGVKSVRGDKNPQSLAKVKELITFYVPQAIILEDTSASSRRAPRIRELAAQIVETAKSYGIRVVSLSRRQIRQVFFADGQGTKHAIAEVLSKRFPNELGLRLPPKRRPWMSEDHRMGIFDAVALVVVFRLKQRSKVAL
jgi:Holliday junction resolvasome RuvABC endonuclease subunit